MVSKLVSCDGSDGRPLAAGDTREFRGVFMGNRGGVMSGHLGTGGTDVPGTTKSMPERRDGGASPFGVQKRPVCASARLLLLLAIAGALGLGACKREIGDECSTAADCEPNGTRICDLSQPGGYCTIANCDETSCPDSVCIRFFPTEFLTRACNPVCEDLPCLMNTDGEGACPAACPQGGTNDCTIDELCLDAGVCASRTLERRYCQKGCSDNGDCRGGYECRAAGTKGSMALTSDLSKLVRFCAPAN
jgi:hypothetical protein